MVSLLKKIKMWIEFDCPVVDKSDNTILFMANVKYRIHKDNGDSWCVYSHSKNEHINIPKNTDSVYKIGQIFDNGQYL